MHSQIFMDFTEFLTVIRDVISTPSPFQQMKLYIHCAFYFHCKRVTITSQGMFEEKKEEIWHSPMTKAPTPTEMSKGQSDNTNNATKKFD